MGFVDKFLRGQVYCVYGTVWNQDSRLLRVSLKLFRRPALWIFHNQQQLSQTPLI